MKRFLLLLLVALSTSSGVLDARWIRRTPTPPRVIYTAVERLDDA